MAKRLRALTGTSATRAGLWVAMMVAALLALPAVAHAVTIEIDGEIYAAKCTPCHANYTQTLKHPKYIFTHGNHITYECRTCHPQFPHRPEGTDKPVMKDCWNCHGLKHGPQGVLATGTCVDCHGKQLESLRPTSHVPNWAKEPHVDPANKNLISECSMCHTESQCDTCHAAVGVYWKAPEPMIYDAGNGCMACHGNPNLVKNSPYGLKSFEIRGLETSAHRDLTCPQCHLDFAYTDVQGETNVWSVNAGLACAQAGCHDTDDAKTKKNEDQVTAYEASIHGTKIAEGDLKSATCGSCHGGHAIKSLTTTKAKNELQMASKAMCADCHEDRWDNYDDAYHGAAYKKGALDAPACWDCHGAHDTLPAADPKSLVHETKVAATCASCHQHKDASEDFAEQSAEMIHAQYDTRLTNPILQFLSRGSGGK